MRVNIKRLKSDENGHMPFELNVNIKNVDSLGDGIYFDGSIRIKGNIGREEGLLLVNGEIQTKAILQCSRCLRIVKYPLRVTFRQVYSETGDGEDILPIRGDGIDLDRPVKESILLELPIKVLCREECKGLCPICGGDRNVTECDCKREETDLRMQKLKEFFKE